MVFSFVLLMTPPYIVKELVTFSRDDGATGFFLYLWLKISSVL